MCLVKSILFWKMFVILLNRNPKLDADLADLPFFLVLIFQMKNWMRNFRCESG